MADKYIDTFDTLNHMAKVKMAMNQHKGSIEDCPPETILKMLKGEVEELEHAVLHKGTLDVLEESADVMNFLLALVHQQIGEYRRRKE